jgi:hypothetical protein
MIGGERSRCCEFKEKEKSLTYLKTLFIMIKETAEVWWRVKRGGNSKARPDH